MVKKPQVWDVWIYWNIFQVLNPLVVIEEISKNNIYYRYIFSDGTTGKTIWSLLTADRNKIFKYYGKRAPRYKRIFGIYYVKVMNE